MNPFSFLINDIQLAKMSFKSFSTCRPTLLFTIIFLLSSSDTDVVSLVRKSDLSYIQSPNLSLTFFYCSFLKDPCNMQISCSYWNNRLALLIRQSLLNEFSSSLSFSSIFAIWLLVYYISKTTAQLRICLVPKNLRAKMSEFAMASTCGNLKARCLIKFSLSACTFFFQERVEANQCS